MKNLVTIACTIGLICGVSGVACAQSVWLGGVFSWSDVPPLDGDAPYTSLGASDQENSSISINDELIVFFANNCVFDGEGIDLIIHEHIDASGGDEFVDVYGSTDNRSGSYIFMGTFENDAQIDLIDHPGLSLVRYLKFIGVSDVGTNPGYDLDAVEAINSMSCTDPCFIETAVF